MTPFAPLFLLAALAGIIPVVLHMINRQKAKDVPFATLRFLRVSVNRTRRRKRIHDLLLMLVRVAALVLLALGLADFRLTSLRSILGGKANSAVVIVLDNSASMGLEDRGRARFDTALRAADQILAELGDGDAVALVAACGPTLAEQGRLDRKQETARQMLAQCRISYERADLGARLQEARKILEKSEAANKEIFVITDAQALSWQSLKEKAADAAPAEMPEGDPRIVVVDVNRAPSPNVALRSVELDAAVPAAGVPLKATVDVYNASTVTQQKLVELYVDGAKEATSPTLSIRPGETAKHEFHFAFRRGGLHKGDVRLVGKDASGLDDQLYFALAVDQQIGVAIVKARQHEISYLDDGFYLERALMPTNSASWALRLTTLTAADLAAQPLSNYAAVYCVNLPALDAAAAERLRQYVRGGGHVVWICGENVQTTAYNQMNDSAQGQLLPAPLAGLREATAAGKESWHVSFLDKKHPALAALTEPASLYQMILVYKHFKLDLPKQSSARVLARLDDGEPLLVEHAVEKGSVLMLATSAHKDWTNLPLRPIFVPLLGKLTFYLAGAETNRAQVAAGLPLVIPLDDETQPVSIEINRPSGEVLRVRTAADNPKVFRYADTHQVGIHAFRVFEAVRPKQLAYAVNIDPDEADARSLAHDELAARLSPSEVVFAEDPDDLSTTFRPKEGTSLWELFLAAVLVALVAESFVANRLVKNPAEEQANAIRPRMIRHGTAVKAE
ncbi:MAG: vWA domain-containing protein [Pirellulales bacterium]